MLTQKTSSRLALPVLLLVLLLAPGTQAVEPYDVVVTSTSFEPGHTVSVEVTGLINQTISIRITDKSGDILSTRQPYTELAAAKVRSTHDVEIIYNELFAAERLARGGK